MPTCLYLRGAPGTGKNTVARLLERDLGWPRLWVHHFDAIYRVIGEYKVPKLTDELMVKVSMHLMRQGKDFMVVRPTRDSEYLRAFRTLSRGFTERCWSPEHRQVPYKLVPVRLTASYANLVTRVTRRWSESPFRLTTKEALDEYLGARPESTFPGETVIDTDELTPEQVAGRIKELLP